MNRWALMLASSGLKPIGVLAELATKIKVPLINAGDGNNEHPTQALLDMYTMRKHFGELRGLTVSIVGDVMHSRVARSNLICVAKVWRECPLLCSREYESGWT